MAFRFFCMLFDAIRRADAYRCAERERSLPRCAARAYSRRYARVLRKMLRQRASTRCDVVEAMR